MPNDRKFAYAMIDSRLVDLHNRLAANARASYVSPRDARATQFALRMTIREIENLRENFKVDA